MRLLIALIIVFGLGVGTALIVLFPTRADVPKYSQSNLWQMQSIDTVKYSRDLAREKKDSTTFDAVIFAQTKLIAQTGASHVAISTPYDEEFIPFLAKWVKAARDNKIDVWFRGNFSGWEGWFEYKDIDRQTHKDLLTKFIANHGDLFEDGDVFTSCTECENGGPGDPRQTGDVDGFRQFLIDEYQIAKDGFRKVAKNVTSNYFPMNGDVAWLIMDKETTKALGGVVVIDHYVATPLILANGLKDIANRSGGKVVLGEFGAPIPDIHGNMTDAQQAKWIGDSLKLLSDNPSIIGVNYWTGVGGSTQLWNDNGDPRQAVKVVESYFKPGILIGVVTDERGVAIEGAKIELNDRTTLASAKGAFKIPYIGQVVFARVSAPGYQTITLNTWDMGKPVVVKLTNNNPNLLYKVQVWAAKTFRRV